MAILVTGGAGYIGSVTTQHLLESGEKIVIADNLSTGFLDAVPAQVIFEELDIGSSEMLNLLRHHKISSVVHFAASTSVPESVQNPLKYWQNNFINSLNLLNNCVEAGVSHFVFSSTAAVYGEPRTSPVKEDIELNPISAYGSSKLAVEKLLADLALAKPIKYVALRYFNVAGAHKNLKAGQKTKGASNLIKVACELAVGKRSEMQLFGTDYPTPDGTCIRDFIHVEDVARAHILALKYLAGGGSSLVANLGTGSGYSVQQVVQALEQISGKNLNVIRSSRRPGDIVKVIADCSLAKEKLGWTAKHLEIEEICASAYAWEKLL